MLQQKMSIQRVVSKCQAKLSRSVAAMALAAAVAAGGVVGCASTGEKGSRDELTANVGNYSPAPSNLVKAQVGVPPFAVGNVQSGSFSGNNEDLERIAADQMTSLLHLSGRFDVVERAQVQQLLAEQNMEGIVRPDQMAKAGQVLGVDYLLVGKVTNFRVKAERTQKGVDVGALGGLLGDKFRGGSTGFDQKNMNINTDVGVDIRLVDPTTGKVAAAHFGEFRRTDTAESLGISVMGMGANSDADIQVGTDDAGKVLRLAFDDALRKMMPEIDKKLQARAKSGAPAAVRPAARDTTTADAPAPVAPTPAAPAAAAADAPAATPAAKKFCGECGEQLAAAAKFCPKCGKAQ